MRRIDKMLAQDSKEPGSVGRSLARGRSQRKHRYETFSLEILTNYF